jgi:hypothetical protein
MLEVKRIILLLSFILLFLVGTLPALIEFTESVTGGTLENTWNRLGSPDPSYDDDPVPIADASMPAPTPEGDGWGMQFYDANNSYFGIAATYSGNTADDQWVDLTITGYVYAYATAQNGANQQVGLFYRADETSSVLYGRVLLNLPDDANGEIKVQTYASGWDTQYINLDNSLVTTGWHQLKIVIGGVDHNEVTVYYDDMVTPKGTITCAALGPTGLLSKGGPIGCMLLHYTAAPPTPAYFDGITVETPTIALSKVWSLY